MHAIYYSDLNAQSGQWSERKPIYIEGIIDGNAVDPDILQLQDGRYLLTYMRGQFGQANPEAVSTIYSAWSYDGVYFFDPQAVFKPVAGSSDGSPVVTDPSVVQLKNGSWLMAISNPVAANASLRGGARYTVTGTGDVLGAIQRMVPAHAAQMASDSAYHATTSLLDNGVSLTVHATDPANVDKVRALGFMGFMVLGDHHLPHHLMMATGSTQAPATAAGAAHQH